MTESGGCLAQAISQESTEICVWDPVVPGCGSFRKYTVRLEQFCAVQTLVLDIEVCLVWRFADVQVKVFEQIVWEMERG